jgi:N-acetylmuramoyl-L-alanine amidase
MKRLFAAAAILCLLLPCAAAGAQAEELEAVMKELGGTLCWDPVTAQGHFDLSGKGIGERGDRISFQVGFPWVLVNYHYLVSWPDIRREQGRLLFSRAGLENLKGFYSACAMRADQPRVAAILIDAGHGGSDSGAIGTYTAGQDSRRLQEKDVVLAVARTLHELLRKEFPDRKILLTRSEDVYLKLEERAAAANTVPLGEHEAVIFISIHANASFNSGARGYEVWVLPGDYRRQLIDSAVLDEEGKAIAPILNVLLEEEYSIESITLARQVLAGFDEEVGAQSENRGIREESWFVVRNARMPSILIELGFLTNPQEAQLLAQEQYLQKLANGIYTGVRRFVHAFEKTKGFTE